MQPVFDRLNSLGYMTNLVGRLLVREIDGHLAPHGISVGYMPVFFALAAGDALTQRDLTTAAQVEQPTMAATLARMERDGLIERRANPDDGRSALISLTQEGRGKLAARQTVSTLPEGYKGSNFCSEILVSADGKFVYAGNRLHDSIAVFAVGEDGTLTHVQDVWTQGDYPRSFGFDPTGRFL